MKNNLLILTKVFLKNGSNSGSGRKKNRSQLLIIALVAVACAPLVIGIVKFLSLAYTSLAGIGQQGVLLSLGISASSLVIFFFGIFYTLNTFYFSNDVEGLLPLPLKPGEILGAKFFVTVFFEYLTEFVLIVPILAVFGVKSSAGAIYWLYALLIFLLVPIIPLALASYIIMPIMRFTAIAKNKDRFRLVSSLIALALGLGFNFAIQRFAVGNIQPDKIQNLFLQGNNSLIGTISRIFPTSRFAAESLVNTSNINGLISLLLFLLVSVLAFVLFEIMGEALYFKGVMGVSESSARRKKLTKDEFIRNTSQSSVLKTYLLKELKILFRTPIYFLNCVIMNFLYPVILIFPFLAQNNGSQIMGQLGGYLNDKNMTGKILVIAFGVILFMSSSNAVTATSISREGKNLYINKYIPVRYSTQLMAKVLSGVVLSTAGIISLIIMAEILFKIQLSIIIAMFFTGLTGVIFTAFTGILIDIYNPKLNWDNEQKAVKQNMNVLLSMLICSAIGGLTIYTIFKFKLDFAQTLAAITVFYGLLDIVLYYVISTIGVKQFIKLEA